MKSGSTSSPGAVLLAPSTVDYSKYDAMHYLKGAAAGGICCSITHGALTPVDVVKTRVQLDPSKVGYHILRCSAFVVIFFFRPYFSFVSVTVAPTTEK